MKSGEQALSMNGSDNQGPTPRRRHHVVRIERTAVSSNSSRSTIYRKKRGSIGSENSEKSRMVGISPPLQNHGG
jgi:hypothetical protein